MYGCSGSFRFGSKVAPDTEQPNLRIGKPQLAKSKWMCLAILRRGATSITRLLGFIWPCFEFMSRCKASFAAS